MSHRRRITVARSLAGNLAPLGMAGAVLLGTLAGCWVGWNLTFAVLVTLALVLNINVRLLALSAAVAAAIAWLAAPLNHDLGQWLLDEHKLRGIVNTFASGPVGALSGCDVYTLIGGTPIALGVGLPVAALLVRSMRRESSRRRGFLTWLGDEAAMTHAGDDGVIATTALLRPYGLIMALAVLPGWVAVTAAVVPQIVRQAAVAELTHQNGATASIGQWEYRLWSGELRCEDVRFADPARPDVDRLRIDSVTGRLGAAAVLRGKLHIRQLRLAGLTTDRRRLEAAEVVVGVATFGEHTTDAPRREMVTTAGDESAHDTLEVDVAEAFTSWGEVARHAERYRSLCDTLLRCANYDASPDSDAKQEGLAGLVALASTADEPQRCQLDRAAGHPPAQRIEIVGLPESWGLGDDAAATWQSSAQDIDGQKHLARLWLMAPARRSLELAIEIDLCDPAARRPLRISLRDVSAQQVADWHVGGVQLAASGGTVDVDAEGWVDGEQLVMSVTATGERLAMSVETPAAARQPNGAATIHYDVLAGAVAKTRRLSIDARMDGTWQRPRLTLRPSRLLADMDYELLLQSRQLAHQQPALPATTNARFRAPQSQRATVAMPTTTAPSANAPTRPNGPGIVRVSPPIGGAGLRVEVARSMGVSVAGPGRIYVEQPRRAVISHQADDMTTADVIAAIPTKSSAISSEPQPPPRTPLPPDWLKTGYDMSPQSTAAGRRWSARQSEDRQRADKVLSHRFGAGAQR